MKRAYVSVTYLWSFEPHDLGLSEDCTDEELEAAADEQMEKITNAISDLADIYPNDVEVSVA